MIYLIGIIAALLLLFVLMQVFDSEQFADTFRAYWALYGIWSAIAWMIVFIARGAK